MTPMTPRPMFSGAAAKEALTLELTLEEETILLEAGRLALGNEEILDALDLCDDEAKRIRDKITRIMS